MAAVAFLLLWGGYGLTFWGWTLVKGYDIGVSDIFIPGKFKGTWPPVMYNNAGGPAAAGPTGKVVGEGAKKLAPSATVLPGGSPATAVSASPLQGGGGPVRL